MNQSYKYFKNKPLMITYVLPVAITFLIGIIFSSLTLDTWVVIVYLLIDVVFVSIIFFARHLLFSIAELSSSEVVIRFGKTRMKSIKWLDVISYEIIKEYRYYYLKIYDGNCVVKIYVNKKLLKKFDNVIQNPRFSEELPRLISEIKYFRWQ